MRFVSSISDVSWSSGEKRRYQNLPWTSSRPLPLLLEQKLSLLFSKQSNVLFLLSIEDGSL